jgi:hypothetical protein
MEGISGKTVATWAISEKKRRKREQKDETSFHVSAFQEKIKSSAQGSFGQIQQGLFS